MKLLLDENLSPTLARSRSGPVPGRSSRTERLRVSIFAGLRQVELEFAHRFNSGADVRLPAHEDIPDACRKQVEQHFRYFYSAVNAF